MFIKLEGNSTRLHLHLEHPLQGKFKVGLFGLFTDQRFSRLRNTIHISKPLKIIIKHDSKTSEIEIAPLDYTISTLEHLLLKKIKDVVSISDRSRYYLRINKQTGICELRLPVKVDLGDFGKLLGFECFEKDCFLKENVEHVAKYFMNTKHCSLIEIHCNLVEPSIVPHREKLFSHNEADILYTFCPSEDGTIHETPNPIHYIPVRRSLIQEIIIEIKNEYAHLMTINNMKWFVYLDLIRDDSLSQV